MLRALALILVVLLALAGWGYANAIADPIVHRTAISLSDWPQGAPPIKVALISDLHVQGPDMPPERVARLVAQVNAQKPDLILLAGDFVGDHAFGTHDYSDTEIAAPFAGLRAPLGVFAMLGNHDYVVEKGRGAIRMRAALHAIGIPTLDNRVQRVGPITLAGIGDFQSGHSSVPMVLRQIEDQPGPIVAFTHSPDVAPLLPPRIRLLLAGHTHCGQVVFPVIGALATSSRYGQRYRCGVIQDGLRTVVVGAGWGTSVLPIRFGALPDWWLVTLGPQALAQPGASR